MRGLSLVGGVGAATVKIHVQVATYKVLGGLTGTATEFLAEVDAQAKANSGAAFRKVLAAYISTAYADGKTAGAEINAAITKVTAADCATPADKGVKIGVAVGDYKPVDYNCIVKYDAKVATKFGKMIDPVATLTDPAAFKTAVGSTLAGVAGSTAEVTASGICSDLTTNSCFPPAKASLKEVVTVEGKLIVMWSMGGVLRKSQWASNSEDDPAGAGLVHKIVYDAFTAANGGTAVTGMMGTLGSTANGYFGGNWNDVTGDKYTVDQAGTFEVKVPSTIARRLEDVDENGALRELQVQKKTHTITWVDNFVYDSTLAKMKLVYEQTTTLLSEKVGGAVTTALAAICPNTGDGCTGGVGNHGTGFAGSKPTYVAGEAASLSVTKPAGWTLGRAPLTTVVGGIIGAKIGVLSTTTAAELTTDVKFNLCMKEAILEALKLKTSVTTLDTFAIASVTWTARQLDDGGAAARQLVQTVRTLTVTWTATTDATNAAAIKAGAMATAFTADFKTTFTAAAQKPANQGDKLGIATITGDPSSSAMLVVAAAAVSSAVGALASGIIVSLLSLSLM